VSHPVRMTSDVTEHQPASRFLLARLVAGRPGVGSWVAGLAAAVVGGVALDPGGSLVEVVDPAGVRTYRSYGYEATSDGSGPVDHVAHLNERFAGQSLRQACDDLGLDLHLVVSSGD